MPTNPFVTSTAVRTRHLFFGRQDEIKRLYAAISATPPRHCAVVGLPRSGKSSLLMALGRPDMQKQYLDNPRKYLFVTVDCSVTRLDAPSDLYVRLLQRISQACGRDEAVGDLLDAATFKAAVDELRGKRRLVLLLDEFDALMASSACDDTALANLRDFAGPDVAVVVAANDTIERLCRRNQKMQAELWTMFDSTIFPRLLTREEAFQLIERPIVEAGVTLDSSIVDFVIDLIGRHPFFLQLAGKELFDALSTGESLDDAGRKRLGARLAEVCRPHFEGLWRGIDPAEQAVFAAIISGAALSTKQLAGAERLRNLNVLVFEGDDYVPFSALFGQYARATLIGARPAGTPREEAPLRAALWLLCDSYAKNIAVRLEGAASLVAECDEPLDRNIRAFAVRGREEARAPAWRKLIKISGTELYEKLFADHPALAEAYRCGRDAAGDSRLTLRFAGPRDFIGLPFELLHDSGGRALALDHPICRMVSGQICRRAPLDAAFFSRAEPRQALIITANVSGELVVKGQRFALPPVQGVEEEGLRVRAALEARGWQVTLLSGADATLETVGAVLDTCPHQLIHYSGHGVYAELDPDRSGLVLRDSEGDAAVLEALRLRQLLKESRARFVFLSCCSGAASGDAARLLDSDYLGVIDAIIAAGVPAALGYRWPVDITGATLLAQTFYDKLHQRQSLAEALLLARQEVRAQLDDQTWAAPILVVQE